ncbi:MAG: hypothetical protein HOJ67_00620 [Rhodospirillaceae bacterium]|nr:hypothetical protein [Rhodospirillaceae bacterium]MBT6219820.1 hypothetical protein [Rhodospirillaceae bacterium]MBT6360670.1 hypothetical protein [Rhodospirillaceae bacterium]
MTDAELKEKLGDDYVAPVGLYKKTKEMSFLGSVNCTTTELTCGEWTEIVLDYEVGASGIADGAWIKATFKFYSDWALFQTTDPAGANYVSAEYQAGPCAEGQVPATVQSLKVRFDQKGHERPFQKAIIVDTVDGYVKPGDHIIMRLGDRRGGGAGTRVQTFTEKGFRFRFYIDPLGTSRFCDIPGDVVIDINPGAAEHLVIAGTRMVRSGEAANLGIRAEDAWGNTCYDNACQFAVTATRDGKTIYEGTLDANTDGWCFAGIDDIPTGDQGEIEITASMVGRPEVKGATFYLTVDDVAPAPRLFFGDLHVHSDNTVGINDTTYNISYGRDIARLDYFGYTANDFQITKDNWDDDVEIIDSINEDGRFVAYPGTEWCGNSSAGGDHNVVFLHGKKPEFPFDAKGNIARSFEWNEDMDADTIMPGAWPLEELWATYIHDPEGHLMMPHVGGRRCIMDWYHPTMDRLVEIGSAWGHFPWLYQDVAARGYKLGVSLNGDEHRGRCGGGVPGTAVFGTKGGVTGLVCDSLDRKTVGKALRARRTWGTTGERLVAFSWCGDNLMGDEFDHKGPAKIEYRFLGDAGWDEISLFDQTGIIATRNLQEEAGYSDGKIRVRFGGARIRDRYRWADWRGRIDIRNGVIHSFKGLGLEHKEETVWRAGPTEIGFRTDTYGDTDAVEIDMSHLEQATIKVSGQIHGYVKVGNPLDGNPFVHSPEFELEVSGADLLNEGIVRKELGGVELFVAIERMSGTEMQRDVSGSFEVDAANGPHGHRPVWIQGRQRDDGKAWTSAMYITF